MAAEDRVLTADEVVQGLRAIRHVTPTGEQEYVSADRIARSHEALRAGVARLRLHLEAIALGVANGSRGFDLAWAEIAEAALAGRDPVGTHAMSWLAAARRADRERAAPGGPAGMAEEFEDVLVIRVRRPAGVEPADTKGMSAAEAARRGDELAALQSITVKTAELAFTEELIAAWEAVLYRCAAVQRGTLNLGGEASDAGR